MRFLCSCFTCKIPPFFLKKIQFLFAQPWNFFLLAAALQMNLSFPKAMRWWEKGLHPNMREVESAQDLADSLLSAGDRLVVVDFFSPGCGGCRALHPKVPFLRPIPTAQHPTAAIPVGSLL
jgi:thiol-disulfide isomerase/thioredoxin